MPDDELSGYLCGGRRRGGEGGGWRLPVAGFRGGPGLPGRAAVLH